MADEDNLAKTRTVLQQTKDASKIVYEHAASAQEKAQAAAQALENLVNPMNVSTSDF